MHPFLHSGTNHSQAVDYLNQSENNQLKVMQAFLPLQHTWVFVKWQWSTELTWTKPPQLYSYCCTDWVWYRNKVSKGQKSKKAQLYLIFDSDFSWQDWAKKQRDEDQKMQMNLCTKKAWTWVFQEYWVTKQPFFIVTSSHYIGLAKEILMFLPWWGLKCYFLTWSFAFFQQMILLKKQPYWQDF